MPDFTQSRLTPVILLALSNVFMTFAWYGHLNFKDQPLWLVVLVSWGIAFFEYCLMVPANRWGSSHFHPAELKIIQEVVTLVVFTVFAIAYLKTRLQWNHIAAFLCVLAAVGFTFLPSRFSSRKNTAMVAPAENQTSNTK